MICIYRNSFCWKILNCLVFIKSPIYEKKLIFDKFRASQLLIGMTKSSEIFAVNRKSRVVSFLKISII